jgi:ABC-2 type transport system ATP-binding protein
MRRRLDLAMSLVSRPEVIFLDEPSTGLDPRSRLAIWEAVQALADEGATILLTTQYLEEADRLADRIAVVSDGRISALGTADELKSRVGEDTVELFFADADALATAEARLGGGGRVDGLSLRVPATGAADIRRVLEALDGVAIDRLELRKPTLDDVFLTLT